MADAFISYRRVPSAPVAISIQAKLQSDYGLDIYVDTTRTDGTTVSFPERLMQAITDAPVFICLLGENDGQHTLESEWVLKEIDKAYELGKFCIPVFQESYRPLPDIPESVKYLLQFDGVHYLDQKNIHIDASIREIANLVRPHVKQPRTGLYFAIVGILIAVIGIGVIASGILNTDDDPQTDTDVPASTEVAEDETPTPQPTDTVAPTMTETVAPLSSETQAADPDPQTTTEPDPMAVATADINVRSGPSTEFTPNGAFRAGEQAQILAIDLSGDWLKIDLGASGEGWVLRSLVAIEGNISNVTRDAGPPTPTPKPQVSSNEDWSDNPVIVTMPLPDSADGVEVALVPPPVGGIFEMANGTQEPIDALYWIDVTEVTRGQLRECLAQNHCDSSAETALNSNLRLTDDHPANYVKHDEAVQVCDWRGGRLPTEGQWEYAARGPSGWESPNNIQNTTGVVWRGNTDLFPDALASDPLAVNSLSDVSWVGAVDMLGNVMEWTETASTTAPDEYIIKGIAFSWTGIQNFRFSKREDRLPTARQSDLGFRCIFGFNVNNPDGLP